MLAGIGTASFAQFGSSPTPPPQDSLVVCFTVGEAQMIGDTLWSRLDQRDKARIAHTIVQRQREIEASYQRDLDRAQAQIAPLMASEAQLRVKVDAERAEAVRWKLKAKGRGSRGLLLGIGLGGLATYGGLRLAGAIR